MNIPGFAVQSVLSEDPAATVYYATAGDGRPVALTVGHAPIGSATDDQWFRSWAGAMVNAGQHPNVADLVSYGLTDDGRPFVAMTTSPYGTLADPILDGAPRHPDAVWGTAVALADALATVHANWLVHGAVRPMTVLIADGGAPVLAACDTLAPGLSMALAPDAYSAPERVGGAGPSTASDV